MKKIISILLAVCLLLSAFPLIASAVAAPEPPLPEKRVYFADYNQFKDAYLYCWDYFVSPPYEWPGIKMDVIEEDENGNVIYSAVLPEDTNSYIISNGNGMQTVDISYEYWDLITLTSDFDADYHYEVSQTPTYKGYVPRLSKDVPLPTEPVTEPVVEEKNLIVLDNMEIEDPVYICLRTGEDAAEETTIRARMELFDSSDYGEPRYRFTYPDGMKYFYFTNGKKSTQEVSIESYSHSTHVHLSGSVDENGLYNVYYDNWCGGIDPAFTQGPSHTLFDRFCEEYVVPDDGGFDNSFTDLYQLYDEVWEHENSRYEVDRVLVHAESFVQLTAIYEDLIGNRVVTRSGVGFPFDSGYGIYDVQQDRFVPLNGKTVEEYDGLKAAFDEIGTGRLLGDIDGDDSITVIDATMIQRCTAMMAQYPEDDEMGSPIGNIRCYSDFNRDGERDILDATAIQRYLIGM